jgi:alginate O-acetyltransferase complex protein AlgI
MLFNSYGFILLFLPIAFFGYVVASRFPVAVSVTWLALCSLIFYGLWNPPFLLLLLGSILFNYVCGQFIARADGTPKNSVFVGAVAANLLLLSFFKYLGPLLAFGGQYGVLHGWADLNIILPLGISFFTVTQIGFLVDCRDGLGGNLDPIRYTLFVTFFPHLIAGPILHVRDIGPQLTDPTTFQPSASKIAPGLSLFALGVAKKVFLADPLEDLVATGYSHPTQLTMVTSWITALAYSLQLYFDFSGYSDMAIGISGLFGFRLPTNFNSPYKARGVIEYWQRWHMTLSRYLALLIFNPISLAITRRRVVKGLKVSHKALKSPAAFFSLLALPTFVTMGLAGVWHGAGLQFLVFGLLHATYLIINHAARVFGKGSLASRTEHARAVEVVWKVGLTYLAVLVGSVFFRAASCTEAVQLLVSMVGGRGIGLPVTINALNEHLPSLLAYILPSLTAPDPLNIRTLEAVMRILLGFVIVWVAPNTQQILGTFAPTLEQPAPLQGKWQLLHWRPGFGWAVVVGTILWAMLIDLHQPTTFLYFQF